MGYSTEKEYQHEYTENYDYVKNNINKFVSDFSVNWITHTVQSGDNLWNLSKKYEVKLDDLSACKCENKFRYFKYK